ncbi:MAG: putative lipid II flippase FtsW [Candidatus Nealsonbacteria bacterium]
MKRKLFKKEIGSKKKPDYVLVSVITALILLGLVILVSVSASLSHEKYGSPNFYLFHHILYGLLPGAILGFAAYKLPFSFLRKWSPLFLLVSLVLMVLVFIPGLGMKVGGASRWLSLGPISSIQPSEFLKISFLLYLSAWLAARTERKKEESFSKKPVVFSETFAAFLAIMGLVSVLLVLQPDVSTLGIIVICAAIMYFLAGTPIKHSLIVFLSGIAGLAVLIKLAPYRFNRFLAFIRSDIDPMGISYQIKQALIAVGSGGIFGTGLGISVQKYGFLPQPMADSIFAVFCEEAGFAGGLVLISLFLIFAWRGFKIAKNTSDKFCKLVSLGITSWIVLQAFVNMGSMVGLMPLTGIPLPFVSYGGSAIIAELIGVGILFNISKETKTI